MWLSPQEPNGFLCTISIRAIAHKTNITLTSSSHHLMVRLIQAIQSDSFRIDSKTARKKYPLLDQVNGRKGESPFSQSNAISWNQVIRIGGNINSDEPISCRVLKEREIVVSANRRLPIRESEKKEGGISNVPLPPSAQGNNPEESSPMKLPEPEDLTEKRRRREGRWWETEKENLGEERKEGERSREREMQWGEEKEEKQRAADASAIVRDQREMEILDEGTEESEDGKLENGQTDPTEKERRSFWSHKRHVEYNYTFSKLKLGRKMGSLLYL